MALNETHDTGLQSWVASANTGNSDFPIQNLPFAVFRRKAGSEAFRGGVAIGDQVLDMAAVRDAKALPADVQAQVEAAAQGKLNTLMGMTPAQWLGGLSAVVGAIAWAVIVRAWPDTSPNTPRT